MKYVNTIRRIITINNAICRTPDTDRYDDIVYRLMDKRDMLVKSLKEYKRSGIDKKQRLSRRKQIRLTCKLLGVDYFDVMR